MTSFAKVSIFQVLIFSISFAIEKSVAVMLFLVVSSKSF